jgi:hypothetical protein
MIRSREACAAAPSDPPASRLAAGPAPEGSRAGRLTFSPAVRAAGRSGENESMPGPLAAPLGGATGTVQKTDTANAARRLVIKRWNMAGLFLPQLLLLVHFISGPLKANPDSTRGGGNERKSVKEMVNLSYPRQEPTTQAPTGNRCNHVVAGPRSGRSLRRGWPFP